MRPGVSDALRIDLRRQASPARRPTVSAQSAGFGRAGSVARFDSRRRCVAEDRGRLKSPEYVANITRVYRQALDDLRFTNDDLRSPGNPLRKSEIVNRKYEMEMAFSRGLYTGWFRGVNNQELVHARFGKKRGVFLGDVTGVQGEKVFVELRAPLKPGDGVVFDAGHPEDKEEGGRVYSVRQFSRDA